MTRPILLAGILGGLLGVAGNFVLARWFPTATKPDVPENPPQQSDARTRGEELVAHLQAGKNDEFLAIARSGFAEMSDKEYDEVVKKRMKGFRELIAKAYGQTRGFEFLRETVVGASIVEVAYLEKFSRNCVVWFFYLYNNGEGWLLMGFFYSRLDGAFNAFR
ncbi:MAG: hypothetical protein L0241_26505 [Planctomycetia bacterium]|nr:hypothetical protein [Planctomycetia bacterium]